MTGGEEAPGAGPLPGGRRRGIVAGVIAGVGILAVVGVLLATLAAQNTSGEPALREAQDRAAAGLADLRSVVSQGGGELEVTWTSTPAPVGDDHLVVARLKVLPSGEVSEAEFVVSGTQVGWQNALARRILEFDSGA